MSKHETRSTRGCLFSYERPDSFVNRLRIRRAHHFRSLLETIPRTGAVRILDLGGTHHYWRTTGLLDPARYHITLFNLEAVPLPEGVGGFAVVAGDAMRLDLEDDAFDVVFSNSVIEHMGSREGMRRMAAEVRRVGRRYYIQTPSKWFPLEPHSRLPLFQFLPTAVRAAAIRVFNINYFPKRDTFKECIAVSHSTILLSKGGVRGLFPEARIRTERLFGIAKSYTAFHGWEPVNSKP